MLFSKLIKIIINRLVNLLSYNDYIIYDALEEVFVVNEFLDSEKCEN